MKTVQLKVPTIKCEGCVEKIRGGLGQHEGVQAVNGDPARQEISVTFDPERLGEADIRRAVTDAGFLVG
ncbi:MAG: heavy-metal-associated domain-containing protein [Candidatus Rokuibacteriota bacterium]